MSAYNVNGETLENVYGISGTALANAYDVEGNDILNGIVPMDWSNIPQQYRSNINDAVTYAKTYLQNHNSAYVFPVLTDVHDKFYNEPNYVLYNHPNTFDKFLFLGDMANSYSQNQLNNAVSYMHQADTVNVLALVGNHEFGDYVSGDTLPKVWYQTLIPPSCVVMSADALVYYFDDVENNVRFICLDSCTPIYKSSGVQLFTKNELKFCASAMENAGNKDIIVLNHAMGSGFYLVTDTEQTEWKSDTTITNSSTLWNIINAFKNKSSYTFTDDESVSHTYDFSNVGGNFISYITGHYHDAGNYDGRGFNMITLPSSYYNASGMSIIIVDPAAEKFIWLIVYKNQSTYGIYEYAY